MVERIFNETAEQNRAISAVTLVELAYRIVRARELSVRQLRRQFLDDVRSQIPVYSFTDEIAVRAGLLDGELEAPGVTVELADLLIGVSALHHGHGVLTSNTRHFRLIVGLEVVEL